MQLTDRNPCVHDMIAPGFDLNAGILPVRGELGPSPRPRKGLQSVWLARAVSQVALFTRRRFEIL